MPLSVDQVRLSWNSKPTSVLPGCLRSVFRFWPLILRSLRFSCMMSRASDTVVRTRRGGTLPDTGGQCWPIRHLKRRGRTWCWSAFSRWSRRRSSGYVR